MEKTEKRKMITIEIDAFSAFEKAKVSIITERETPKVNASDVILELAKNREELLEARKKLKKYETE